MRAIPEPVCNLFILNTMVLVLATGQQSRFDAGLIGA